MASISLIDLDPNRLREAADAVERLHFVKQWALEHPVSAWGHDAVKVSWAYGMQVYGYADLQREVARIVNIRFGALVEQAIANLEARANEACAVIREVQP
jgi:hypothetical protein